MTNIECTKQVIQALVHQGVREFCICAGARNAPFVEVLGKCQGLRLYHFFEERSAGFFALGRMKAQPGHPVAVVTTSGTAAAELLPATIEADYTSLPLVLVTADRPSSYRLSGAPQSIIQPGIYSHYVEDSWDLEQSPIGTLDAWSLMRPIHINVCFTEPLIDEDVGEWTLPFGRREAKERLSDGALFRWQAFCDKSRNPLVILSQIPKRWEKTVKAFILEAGFSCYIEALSGLREDQDLLDQKIVSGDRAAAFFSQCFDGVIRIGGVPTLRFWRDLEDKRSHLPVLSFSPYPFSGLSRDEEPPLSMSDLVTLLEANPKATTRDHEWKTQDREKARSLRALFLKYSKSEPSLVNQLSKALPDSSHVFIGNSLPIREWDLCADDRPRGLQIQANRGANGIDGLISTFLGTCESGVTNVALLGDLSALYDLSGLWPLQGQMDAARVHIVVMNNGGGRIFSRLFKNKDFENEHCLEFGHWAAMWGMSYVKSDTVKPEWFEKADRQIIELRPDPEETAQFWQEFDQLWQ